MATDFISWQFLQLLLSAGGGLLLGIFYDLYRLFRYYRSLGRRALPLLDVLWWVLAGVLVVGMWFWVGDIYFFYIVWQGLGFVVYYRLLSRYVFRWGKRVVAGIFAVNVTPLRTVFPWFIMVLAEGIVGLLRLFQRISRHFLRVFRILFRSISDYFKAFKIGPKKKS